MPDPARTDCVKTALEQTTQKRTRNKGKVSQPQPKVTPKVRESMLLLLPWEILNMVFGFLPSQAVINVQRALHLTLDDDFWHSRISTKIFHEVKTPTPRINWKHLCLKLERRLEKSEALATRQRLLTCLDEIYSLCSTNLYESNL